MDQSEIYPYRGTTLPPRTDQGKSTVSWDRVLSALQRVLALVWKQLRVNLTRRHLLVVIIGFLFGRAMLLQELHPFAPACIAAIYTVFPSFILAGVLGVSIGLFSAAQGPVLWGGLANLIFVWIVLKVVKIEEGKGTFSLPVLVFATTIIVKTLAVSVSNPLFYNYIVVFVEALFAGIITYTARKGLETGWDGALQTYSLERKLCLGVLILAALSGLRGLEIAGITLLGMFSRLVILLAVRGGGIGVGAVSGILVGLLPGIAGGGNFPVTVGIYAFSGLMAGVFSRFGRFGAPLGLLLSNIFWSVYVTTPEKLLLTMLETLLAALIYFVMPPLTLLLPEEQTSANQTSPKVDAETKATNRRLNRFAKVFEELAETFDQLASEGRIAYLREENMVSKITDQVCNNCSKTRLCWGRNSNQTRKAIWNLVSLVELEGNEVSVLPGSGGIGHCIQSRELLVAVKCMVSNKQNNQYWQKRVQESQELVSGQLRGVSNLMEKLAHGGEAGGVMEGSEEVNLPLDVELGIARVAKDGTMISGDSHTDFRLKKGKYIVALSDGMGAGPEAAEESRATIGLLTRLLETGFSEELAIKTINSALMLRAQEDNFATLDIAVIDLNQGETEFIKIGAAASFIKRGENIGIISSTSLPIGILQQMAAVIVT